MRKVIVFDLDDTLYPEREYALSGLRAAARAAQELFNLPDLAATFQGLFEDGRRGDIFQAGLAHLGREDPDGMVITALLDAYRNHVPAIALYPDVREVLPELGSRGRLAIITDGYLPPQKLKVESLNLNRVCSPIIYTELLGRQCWKPSPVAFLKLEAMSNAMPEDCVYVGDNPHKDFIAPKARGWKTVRIRRPQTEHGATDCVAGQADVELKDFHELEGWLAAT